MKTIVNKCKIMNYKTAAKNIQDKLVSRLFK